MEIEKFLPTEDGLGKLSNTANLIAIFERSLKLTTNKLLQKENSETIRPIARTRRAAVNFFYDDLCDLILYTNVFKIRKLTISLKHIINIDLQVADILAKLLMKGHYGIIMPNKCSIGSY